MSTPEFAAFNKISRWSRDIIITEKLDGTNAQVFIHEDGQFVIGSRNRWITPEDDNYGFARWAWAHREELISGLGPGQHFGEWWGNGIQRGYGLREKKFSLFNTHRWSDLTVRPSCCDVVPVLYSGPNSEVAILDTLEQLRSQGSFAAKCFMKPEGIVIFHSASQALFKKTLEKDEVPKGSVK